MLVYQLVRPFRRIWLQSSCQQGSLTPKKQEKSFVQLLNLESSFKQGFVVGTELAVFFSKAPELQLFRTSLCKGCG